MPQPEFKPFGKIARLQNAGCLITEKIDGTNGLVYVPHDTSEPVRAGSRNRWLNPATGNKADDNFGFGAWVAANEPMLRRLGPGYHYGEWWGAGIGRRYGLSERRFSLFQAARWTDIKTGESKLPEGTREVVSVVPILYAGRMDGFSSALNFVLTQLFEGGSHAVPGWDKPEGVVISVAGNLYKVTDNGDISKWKQAPCDTSQLPPAAALQRFVTASEPAA